MGILVDVLWCLVGSDGGVRDILVWEGVGGWRWIECDVGCGTDIMMILRRPL